MPLRQYLFASTVLLMVVTALALGAREGAVEAAAGQSGASPGAKAYRFEQLADGVYFATGTGAMTTMSNSMVIVNADHTMLVDTSVTPAAARALVAQIKAELTTKPIKYVFNSHYHFDHAHGNQIFGDDVEIIGHEYIRKMHLSNVLEQRTNRSFTENLPAQIAQMKQAVAQATDLKERATLQTNLSVTEAHWKAVQEVVVKPPNVTFTESMVIHKGGREVQAVFVGRGHTGGDTMVFLPAERIVFTGDFFEGRPGSGVLSYLGDAFIDEWPASLERLKGLDFDVIVPGHGAPLRERKQIDDFQHYLRDFWRQASALRAKGLTVEQAAERMDLSKFTAHYGPRAARPDARAVRRAYELLQLQMPM
jgi:glyoxylase-like metal-dependent hydrolase (beta-lactamase superfamily II)